MTIDYRRIQPADIDQAADFAIKGLRPELYPMRLSPTKIEASLRHFMQSTTDYHMAAFDGPRIVGGIAAAVYESPWFERCDATVVMCRATAVGVGRKLIRALAAWAESDFRVRRVMFPTELDARPGMQRLLARYGFDGRNVVCTYQKD